MKAPLKPPADQRVVISGLYAQRRQIPDVPRHWAGVGSNPAPLDFAFGA